MLLPRFQGVGGPGLPEGDRRVVARLRRDDGRHLAREARRRSVVIAKNRRSLAHTPQVRANGIDIAYESLGRDADPAILMIQGLATPLTGWPDSFGGTNLSARVGVLVWRAMRRLLWGDSTSARKRRRHRSADSGP